MATTSHFIISCRTDLTRASSAKVNGAIVDERRRSTRDPRFMGRVSTRIAVLHANWGSVIISHYRDMDLMQASGTRDRPAVVYRPLQIAGTHTLEARDRLYHPAFDRIRPIPFACRHLRGFRSCICSTSDSEEIGISHHLDAAPDVQVINQTGAHES